MSMGNGPVNEAVVFFDNGVVIKEMLYPEFEALLDHVVGVPEFRDREVFAVFLRINGTLAIRAAVFFKIAFDRGGYVDKSWNIPLGHLADGAGRGPDLGAGPIKLSCRSQCSVSWHQRALWDPVMEGEPNTFAALQVAIKRNRLALEVIEEAVPAKDLSESHREPVGRSDKAIRNELALQFQNDLKERVAAIQQEHKLRVAAMKSEAQEYLERLHRHYREEVKQLQESLNTTKQLFADEKKKNLALKTTLEKQASALQEAREKMQQQLNEARDVEQNQLAELMERFELEKQAAVDSAKTELKEMLDMREVELFYRDEQLGNLRAEVGQLRQEKQNLLNDSGDRLLQKLATAGITYVAYHPGVEPISVPLSDISRYLESPVTYVAEKCGVEKNHYQQWLAHYELPVCNYRSPAGMTCGEPVSKVSKPSRFISGDSDRCAKHGQFSSALASVIKMGEKG